MNYSYNKPFCSWWAHLLYIVACLSLGFYVGANYYYYTPFYVPVTKAVAQIQPTSNSTVTGTITFEQHNDGMHVTGTIGNLTPGKHGFHIHEYGDGSCSDGMCTGDHFNPTKAPHGGRDSEHRHAGDFGNVEADQNGVATVDFVDKGLQLNGSHSILGRALIVHAGEDDLVSQPSGNSGARIGCGVIGSAKAK
jgi:Cu-Zn family superoxide dismutase